MRKLLYIIYIWCAVCVLAACSSTQKNTPVTRRIQAFKARYNTYFNGNEAFKDGRKAQEDGNKDNFSEVIPFYLTGNKATAKIGAGNFDRAIEKSKKTIKQHSITVRPKWTKNRQKTEKDRIWLSQREYNPFLWRAWMLMGEAQMRKGEYMEAASTFAYIERLYFSNPNLVAQARVKEAQCYAEMEWFYDAEDILNRAQRDSFPVRLTPTKAGVVADMQLRQGLYAEAIPNVELALKAEHRTLPKTRLLFLMGQLHQRAGNTDLAYKYYKKVIRRNPPYDIEFNARILQTEAMSGRNSKQMIRKLQSMAKNPKNKDYLDQVYYALGNIYLAKGDTTRAVWAYNEGVEKSTRNGLEKGVVALHLGQLYWEMEKFVDAQKMYSTVLGLMDKEHDEYKTVDERSKILDELLPFSSAVELQDSLQMMAALDSVTRLKKINLMIEELKKKEKEDEKKAAEAEYQKNNPNQRPGTNNDGKGGAAGQNQTAGVWYFYNPTAVTNGRTEFERKWGTRKLEDNWRRMNKTVLDDFNEEEGDTIAVNDSISTDSLSIDGQPAPAIDGQGGEELDSVALSRLNDPHYPEYYLKDIPLTEEQMAASNAKLVDGLYGSAIIYKDRMENFPLAERTFLRVWEINPEFEHNDEILYNLFQLYSRTERYADADSCKAQLIEYYPENEHSKLIADPQFEFKARYGKAVEDSLYTEAYDAFQGNDFAKVIVNSQYTGKEYPNGANRPRFMFLEALSKLELGERDGFMSDLKAIVEKYPQASVSELAGLYVKGLKEGRLLASGKFDMGSIWERRRGFGEEMDSLAADTTFSAEKNCDFAFVVAYERDSVNQNQLLFELARYNFTAFSVRNFDITPERGDGIDMMQVRTFLNYDEAYIYLHRLLNNEEMAHKLQGLKCFIISEENLKKLMHGLSFADYFEFYDETFDRIGSLDIDEDMPTSLDEPEEMPEPDEDDEEDEGYDDDNFIF